MQVEGVSQNPTVYATARVPERREAGPDRDGDGDDKSVKSALPQGVGSRVDTTA